MIKPAATVSRCSSCVTWLMCRRLPCRRCLQFDFSPSPAPETVERTPPPFSLPHLQVHVTRPLQCGMGYWRQRADGGGRRRNPPCTVTRNLLVVKDKVGRTPGELGISKSTEFDTLSFSALTLSLSLPLSILTTFFQVNLGGLAGVY